VVSRHDENLYAERCLRAGAEGYLMKQEPGEILLKAIREVLNGRIWVSDSVDRRLLWNGMRGPERKFQPPLKRLSDREIEVFELIAGGRSICEIAERLHLSVKTVESYRERVKDKLNLNSSNELMRRAIRWVESEHAL
jgi:Response regulator containing a CheY-like receiver domain and an HTH DNA-binding domain